MKVSGIKRYPAWVPLMWTGISAMLIVGAFLKKEPLLAVIGMMGMFIGTSRSTYELVDDGLVVTHRYFEVLKLKSFYPFDDLRYLSVYPYGKDELFVVEMWWKGFRGRKILLPKGEADKLAERLGDKVTMHNGVVLRG